MAAKSRKSGNLVQFSSQAVLQCDLGRPFYESQGSHGLNFGHIGSALCNRVVLYCYCVIGYQRYVTSRSQVSSCAKL